jgi:SWI/SNF-related matrix-associated actin-dependent regulator of chromatin subfamily A3
MDPEELRKHDVVITTYQTVAGEHSDASTGGPSKKKKKKEHCLFDVQWKARPTLFGSIKY